MEGIMMDITSRVATKKSILESEERYRTTLMSIGDGVISTDTEGNIFMMNTVAEYLTGWVQEAALGISLSKVFQIFNEFTREPHENLIEKVLETGKNVKITNHVMLISKDGTERSIESNVAPIRNEKGCITGVVMVFRDFTEKKEKQDQILRLSFYDQLTGIHNRRFFEEELVNLDTSENYPLTLVLLDVNGLKLINDAFGHQLGDKALIRIAELIKSQCRMGDTVARTGGDEFVMLLPRTGEKDAEQVVKRIQDVVHQEKLESIQLSVSSGFGTKNENLEDMMNIYKIAEDSMYRRKLSESSSMRHKTITVILKTLYEKNQREEAHSKRVSAICGKIGNALRLNSDLISELETVGLMHDIGKIAISDEILNKPGLLSYDEWMEIKRHPEIGYNILRSISEYAMLAEYVLAHQERWDGKGYPKGLKGTEIPFFSRIVAIADAYDAMTGPRPYSEPVSREIAFNEIKRKAGTHFDPNIIWLIGQDTGIFEI
jgi:diguanylate cyclase (GGDEF)-like protein/PAS domain S-box-containing protein